MQYNRTDPRHTNAKCDLFIILAFDIVEVLECFILKYKTYHKVSIISLNFWLSLYLDMVLKPRGYEFESQSPLI